MEFVTRKSICIRCGKGMNFDKVHSTSGTSLIMDSHWKGVYPFAGGSHSIQAHLPWAEPAIETF